MKERQQHGDANTGSYYYSGRTGTEKYCEWEDEQDLKTQNQLNKFAQGPSQLTLIACILRDSLLIRNKSDFQIRLKRLFSKIKLIYTFVQFWKTLL